MEPFTHLRSRLLICVEILTVIAVNCCCSYMVDQSMIHLLNCSVIQHESNAASAAPCYFASPLPLGVFPETTSVLVSERGFEAKDGCPAFI